MKKIFSILAVALMLCTLCAVMVSATEPTVTCDAHAFIDFNHGSNDNDGQDAATAKKQLLQITDKGVMSVLAGGGTLVIIEKCYVGADYLVPELASPLLITSVYDGVDYNNAMPAENPYACFKVKTGCTVTFQSDVIFNDMILFQESAQNTIHITNNSTLVMGKDLVCMTKSGEYMKLVADEGSTIIINGGIFGEVTGEGTIIDNTNGAYLAGFAAPVETTVSAPATTVASTSGEGNADDTKPVDASDATEAVASTEDNETSKAADDVATPDDKETVADTTPATDAVTTEAGGINPWIIVAIVAAVIIVVVVIVVIVKKKK